MSFFYLNLPTMFYLFFFFASKAEISWIYHWVNYVALGKLFNFFVILFSRLQHSHKVVLSWVVVTNIGEGNGTPLQSSCLENPMDGGAWGAAVHGLAKNRTRLSFTFTFHFLALEKEMATHSSVLAWRIPGMGGLAGCCLWGRTESDMTEAT